MVESRKNIEIGILLYPEAQNAAIHGLSDLFRIANRVSDRQVATKKSPTLRITHWQLSSKKSKKLTRAYDSHPDSGKNSPTIIIIPPSLGDPLTPEQTQPLTRWLVAQHDAGAALCSVCTGAYLLAETGLLAGRMATTHWTFASEFTKRFPDIQVDTDQLIIDDGDIVTAGGLMAWTDLGLKIVYRLLGPTIMLETARFMILDPPGRQQRYYSNFSPVLHHGDKAILKVQHWLQSRSGRQSDIPAMAKCAGLEQRTFLRRFRKMTGLKPTEYCQHLRVGKARAKLQFTNDNVDEIAWSVGYEDAGAFRKIFQRITGLTPGDYRMRFGQKI